MPLIDLNGLGHFKDKENAMIAEDFSASKAYAAGDYCYYNGTLYKFKTAHAAGAWTIADVEAAKLAHDVSDLKESINENVNDLKTAFIQLDANKGSAIYKNATGSIAVFTDAAKDAPLKDIQLSDGATKVWRTGINLLPMQFKVVHTLILLLYLSTQIKHFILQKQTEAVGHVLN